MAKPPTRHTRPSRSAPRKPSSNSDVPRTSHIYRRGTHHEGRAGLTRPPADRTRECRIHERCGNCEFVAERYEQGLATKHQRGIERLEKAQLLAGTQVTPPTSAPRPFGYRSLFKLAVRPSAQPTESKRFDIGLFRAGTHDVIEIDDCPLHTNPLRKLIRDLRQALEASPITPYHEDSHEGDLRYLAARAAHLTGEIMLTFVVTRTCQKSLKEIVRALRQKGHKINAAYMNIQEQSSNAIFGGETIHIAGALRLRERLCDLTFEVGPTSFFQINPWQAINLYRRLEQVAGTPTAPSPLEGSGSAEPSAPTVAWDLYCGTGQISLILARAGYRVLGIEEIEQAVQDAQHNAMRNRLEERATFLASRVEDVEADPPQWARSPSLVVVNPSRRGLATPTRDRLASLLTNSPQTRLIYVSCEVETLERDLTDLRQRLGGSFNLRQIEAFDMFPQTSHMEWLAVATR